MSHGASSLAAFHLIGDRSGLDPAEAGLSGLRPALFGQYVDMSRVRYDYPVVLPDAPGDGTWVKSLADFTDEVLRKIAAPGNEGEVIRRQVLSLEQHIRTLLAQGQKGSLSLFFEAARREMVGSDGKPEAGTTSAALNQNLLLAREAINLDGELVDCGEDSAVKLITRAWHESERVKAGRLRRRVVRLSQGLTDILQADYMNSPGARAADKLESTMGSANQSVFDFQEMARILRTAPVAKPLPEIRQKRIREAISVLESQQFVAAGEAGNSTFRFAYTDCHEAREAFHERLPQMASLVRAISIAQLELDNRYVESRHDDFFSHFDENRLGPGDLELFPSYLLCLEHMDESNQSALLEILRAGMPFKILALTDDILGDDTMTGGRLSFGIRGQQLARMVVGLEQVFVMQAASSSLYRLRDSVLLGLNSEHPALYCIYSGSADANDAPAKPVAPYLLAAAATESRAFPCFVYDPGAGHGQARRFKLDGNPQAREDWVRHSLQFEGADHNIQAEELVFSLVDFIAADPRYAGHLACVPRAEWTDEMVPAGEFLGMSAKQAVDKVPYLLLLDQDDILHRAIVDDLLIDAARRCRLAWNDLQEQCGINNTHVTTALAEAKKAWDDEKAKLTALASTQPTASASVASAQPATAMPDSKEVVSKVPELATEPEEASAVSSDDPWIETIRCTTCNECTELNDRMFAYNEDKRAYVANPDAGTFRELVEAAETCQVAIIHPGKPRNPDEPGLEELLKRAEPFNI